MNDETVEQTNEIAESGAEAETSSAETVGYAAEEDVSSTVVQYTEDDIRAQIKPLSQNGFVRFFQNIYRKWLGVWYRFRDAHKKIADLIYMVFFFIVFSMGVTIWQYIIMTFLPYAFAALNTGAVGWPGVNVGSTGQQYVIFGDTQGWGYFIAFEIAVFTAQCINFPLQRNITYRSHGNPWWQAMWYFIGWVLVSVATNAIWGICNVYLVYWGVPDAVTGLAKTVLTGGVSMVVFFFVFMIIFPNNVAVAKRATKKYEALVAKNAAPEKIETAKQKMDAAQDRANKSTAEKELAIASAQASGRAIQYFALLEKKEKSETEEEKAALAESIEKAFADAGKAIDNKKEKQAEYDKAFGVE